ncbi:MAG TPA: hypothetical protein VH208_10565 [Myxococcaceae bacterium]|nr:hypothetical protein [Myxococcaceae bacterium]
MSLDAFGLVERASTFDRELARTDSAEPLSGEDQERLIAFLRDRPELFGIGKRELVHFEVQQTFVSDPRGSGKALSEEVLVAKQRLGDVAFDAASDVGPAQRATLEVRRFVARETHFAPTPGRVSLGGMVQRGRLEVLGHFWPGARVPAIPTLGEEALRAMFVARGAQPEEVHPRLEPFLSWATGKASLDVHRVYAVELHQRRWLVDAMTGDGLTSSGRFARPTAAPSPSGPCADESEAELLHHVDADAFVIPWLGDARPARDDRTFCECQAGHPTCSHWRTWQGMWGCGAVMQRPRTCICDECSVDGDCSAGAQGRCDSFPKGGPCGNPLAARVCVYAGDPCHPPESCPAGQECQGGAGGHPACGSVYTGPQPPAAIHR